MRILALELTNFQGIKAARFDFDGHSCTIYGDNATGKTTVFNAVTWLLFDKASTGAKNYNPKTKGPDGDLHYLSHSAQATLQLDDGRLVTLKKIYHEVYRKKSGSAEEECAGNTVDFFIDGVPTKEKEYSSALLAFCGGAERMKMLTMPDYFPGEMAWDTRRQILLDLCGDVSDSDVIASSPELAELSRSLLMPGTTGQYYSVDEYRKIATARKNDLNRELQSIPARIDEARRAMPDVSGLKRSGIEHRLSQLETEKGKLEAERARVRAGNLASSAIANKLIELKCQLAVAQAEHASQQNKQNEGTYAAIANGRKELQQATDLVHESERNLQLLGENLQQLTQRRQALIDEYNHVASSIWDESDAACPTCLRPLPEDKVDELREEFHLRRSESLAAINARGKREASAEMVADVTAKIDLAQQLLTKRKQHVSELERKLDALSRSVAALAPFEQTEIYTRMSLQIEAVRAQEVDHERIADIQLEGNSRDMAGVAAAIQEQQGMLAKFGQVDTQQQRLIDLAIQQKELGRQFERVAHGLSLCDLFIRSKVAMLTDRINGRFESVRFRLFQEQQNGGVKEDCEVMIPAEDGRMVPYTFANSAARMNAGLEIIDVLARHWGISMPVFVDNAESVTRLRPMTGQLIRLVVSESDKQLRLERGIDNGHN